MLEELAIENATELASGVDRHQVLHGQHSRHASCNKARAKATKGVGRAAGRRLATGQKDQAQLIVALRPGVGQLPDEHSCQIGVARQLDPIFPVGQVKNCLPPLLTVAAVPDEV